MTIGTVVSVNGGYFVTANGKSEKITAGTYGEAGGITYENADIWRYQTGFVAFTQRGLAKLTSIGLHNAQSRPPNAAAFIASATPATVPDTVAANSEQFSGASAASAVAEEPSFSERAKQRYGLGTEHPAERTGGEPSFVERMRARHAPPAVPDGGREKAAEPDFAARMKARQGITEQATG